MSAEIRRQISEAIESAANARPSALEFEMAYQARVAIDRIRFAIRQTESGPGQSDMMREAGLQLLDALQRLESLDQRFQGRSLLTAHLTTRLHNGTNGHESSSVSADRSSRPGGGGC